MIVTRSTFDQALGVIAKSPKRALDTETTSLRPYHGGRLFSIAIAVSAQTAYYFNFNAVVGLDPQMILLPGHRLKLQLLLEDPDTLTYLHNAKFDMHMLIKDGLLMKGHIHCTKAQARVEWNEHPTYDLASCAERIGYHKDDTVEKWIVDNGAWEWLDIPGKKQRVKNKHFDRVPFPIISEYALTDAKITFALGERQSETFAGVEDQQLALSPPHRLSNIVHMERALTKVVFEMERRGILIDIKYTERAAQFEADRTEKALACFKKETGRDLIGSNKLFQEIFASEKDKWVWGEPTKTGQVNPSFESDTLKKFENPAAKLILEARNAKSKADFYLGFLYHADRNGVVHPNFNPDGTRTGRFSSSNPNLQNLTDEEGEEANEFIVRRAIIPRPGHCFIMPDYDQMEYRMMLDYAQEMALIEKIKGGLDVHQATAEMMGVTRKEAKTLNFMLLYGGGAQKLADALGISLDAAKALKFRYFSALPGVQAFIQNVITAIHARGFIRNWAGRRSYFPNLDFDYTGPNTLIQGGTADVNKFGLVEIDKFLACKKSKLVLTIHDENPIECHEDEVDEVPKMVQEIMQNVYPARHLSLTVGMEHSWKSLGDKTKGFPGNPRAVGAAGNSHAACARAAVATPC